MTKKDFAHIEAVADEDVQDERPTRHTTIVLMIGLLIVVVMAAFSGGFWLGRGQGVEIASSQDKARLQALIKKQEDELKNLRLLAKRKHKSEEPVSMTQVGELIFYNDLPKQSVTPSPLHQDSAQVAEQSPQTLKIRDMIHQEMEQQPMPEAVKPVTSATLTSIISANMKQTYQIQLASFQNHQEAVAFTQKLDKQFISTRIQEVKLEKLGTWFRVYTGHYENRKLAEQALQQLKKRIHVTGLVVRQ